MPVQLVLRDSLLGIYHLLSGMWAAQSRSQTHLPTMGYSLVRASVVYFVLH